MFRFLRPLAPIWLVLILPAAQAGEPKKTLPTFEQVKQTTERFFAKQPDYRAGDLITRTQVAGLLKVLGDTGLGAPAVKQLLADVPGDDEFLVERLRTPAGKAFMRQVAKYPDAFDRLDRLSRMPQGRATVDALIKGPGGEKLIQYMTTSDGGRYLGKQLSKTPSGADFNKPTGRIYTVSDLLARLRQEYEAAKTPQRPQRG